MLRDFTFDERRIRLINSFIWLSVFIERNWGSTTKGIQHIVLSARTHSFEPIDSDLINAFNGTIIPFGKTTSYLLLIGLTWLIIDVIIRRLDFDLQRVKLSSAMLRKENEYLLKDLRQVNRELNLFLDATSELPDRISELNKYQDRVAELSVDLEGLFQKGERSKRGPFETKENDSLDLFDIPKSKTKNRRPPRKHHNTKPKF